MVGGDIIPLQIYTEQIKYTNYNKIKQNPDCLILDQTNKNFSPNRGISLGHKNFRLTNKQFKQMYYDQLIKSYKNNKNIFNEILSKDTIIIASNTYHHEYADRVLFAKFLENYGAEYKGEIEI